MTDNIQTIYFDSIIPELKATNVKQIFQTLSSHINRIIGTPEKNLLENFIQNERQESSAIGDGVAIVEMRLPRLTKPFVIFTKLSNDVDLKAIDDEPVDLICTILSPEHEDVPHLQRLAKITRAFKNSKFCRDLRESKTIDDIRFCVQKMNEQRAAA